MTDKKLNQLQKSIVVCTAMLMLVAGCTSPGPAPVSEARPSGAAKPPSTTPSIAAPTPGAIATPLGRPGDGPKIHTIQRGETIRSIAAKYGVDYRELAAWNNLENPGLIRVGDTLRVTRPDGQTVVGTSAAAVMPGAPDTAGPAEAVTTPLIFTPPPAPASPNTAVPPPTLTQPPLLTPAPNANVKTEPRAAKVPYSDSAYARMLADAGAATVTAPPPVAVATPVPVPATAPGASNVPTVPVPTPAPPASTAAGDMPDWAWPVKGNIIAKFTESNKGIDIAGTKGTPVLAAATGKVIYNESGFRGYGRLIIVKHNENWLSAYAHNDKVLVKKDEDIKKGQKIAEMGSSDTDRVKLHFEIRKQGKPVDPLKYLPAQ
jgi:lipoprotein NlpD